MVPSLVSVATTNRGKRGFNENVNDNYLLYFVAQKLHRICNKM